MFQFDPRLIAVFSILFIGLGIFNLVLGRNRMLQMRTSGNALPWYRQMGILTGIEYILLGIVLLLNLGISGRLFPGSLASLIVPLYTLVLILAAVVLAAMLLQGLRGNRQRPQPIVQAAAIDNQEGVQESKDVPAGQKTESIQRRRERRQKAAAARRRQSGRA